MESSGQPNPSEKSVESVEQAYEAITGLFKNTDSDFSLKNACDNAAKAEYQALVTLLEEYKVVIDEEMENQSNAMLKEIHKK